MERKAELKFIVCLLIICSTIEITAAICDQECHKYPTPQKFVELKCKKTRDSMFYVDVRCSKTVNGECDGSVTCSGLQTEVLRQVAEDCYWHTRCAIVMNKTFPNIQNLNGSCINVFPDVLESRALCVKTNKILDFYQRRSAPITKKEGVMRISSVFPWDYRTDIIVNNVTFKARKGKKLRVSFLEADLDMTSDHLVFRNNQLETPVTNHNKMRTIDFERGDINLEFSVGTTSRRGKGFVFCFYWLRRNSNQQSHACDLVRGVRCLPGKTRAQAEERSRGRRKGRNRGNSTRNNGT